MPKIDINFIEIDEYVFRLHLKFETKSQLDANVRLPYGREIFRGAEYKSQWKFSEFWLNPR